MRTGPPVAATERPSSFLIERPIRRWGHTPAGGDISAWVELDVAADGLENV
jgi:hypothetical protein